MLNQRVAERERHDGQERRRSILDAARKVFAEKGYLIASMREIARVAALSPGLIYHYWGGKDDLYGAICEEAFHNRAVRADPYDEPPFDDGLLDGGALTCRPAQRQCL